MPWILGSRDGVPNYLRALLYATIIAMIKGDSKMQFIKRRARRHGEALKFLAFLLSAKEDIEDLLEASIRGKIDACLKGLEGSKEKRGRKRDEINETCKNLRNKGIVEFLNVDKKEAARIIAEALTLYKLYEEAKRGNIELEDVKLAEIFGGYGNFALGAAELGLEALYVELNPVAYFAYKTYINPPERKELEEKIKEFLEYLKKEVEEKYYNENAYATFWAYIYKCPHCGEHIPIVAEGSREAGCIDIGKRYRLQAIPVEDEEIPRELSWKFAVYDGLKCYYLCPMCGKEVENPKRRRKAMHRSAVDEAYLFGMKASDLPWAYAVPVGYTDKEKLYYNDKLFEKYKAAMLYLLENRDEIKEYVAYEEIPRSISSTINDVLTKLKAAGIYRRTQLMTPRQIIGYYKAIKRLKEFKDDEKIKDRLAMGILKALQTNVLGRYNKRRKEVEHITSRLSYDIVKLSAELTIPGKDAYTITSLLENLPDIITSIKGKLEALNEAAQRLKEHPELYKKYDFAFVDPPYLNAIPYFDLSYLYYARLKKLYGERLPGAKYTLDEIRELDLTSDDPMEYGKKLAEALRGISSILKDDGLIFFQFAPPKNPPKVEKDGKTIQIDASDVRRATLAAILSAGLFPVAGHPVLLESSSSQKSFRPGETTVKTMILILAKAPNIEKYLSEEEIELFESYSGGKFSEFLKYALEDHKIGAEYAKKVLSYLGSPRIEDIPALAYILVSPIVALNFPDASIEEIENLLRDADKYVDFVFDIYVERAFGVRNFTKKANEDPTYIYFLGLALGGLDIRSLKVFKIKDESINKAERFFREPEKAKGKHLLYIRRPKMLVDIGAYTQSLKAILEAIDRGERLLGEKYRDFRRFLERYKESFYRGLEEYKVVEGKKRREEDLLDSILSVLPE